MTFNFIPGYVLLIMDAFQIFGSCLMGTFLEIMGEKFFGKICKISWYLLPVPERKYLHTIMISAFKIRNITMGLKILNLNSFIEVIIQRFFV